MTTSNRPSFVGLYHSLKELETKCLQMVILFCHLILMARKKKTTLYITPARAMGVFSAGLGDYLEELFTINKEMGDPLYGSLVVNSTTDMPSGGYFAAAKLHGFLKENANAEENTLFWQQQVQKVYTSEVSVDLKKLFGNLTEIQKRDLKTLLDSPLSH